MQHLLDPKETRRTKILWSIAAHSLNQDMAKRVASMDVDAIRLVYDRRHTKDLLGFLEAYDAFDGQKPSVLLDISTWTQGMVTGIGKDQERELVFGEELKVVPAGEKGDLQIETSMWAKLFSNSSTVYLGFGVVVLKVREREANHLILEVLQGGRIYDGMDVYVPDTRYRTEPRNIQEEDLKAFAGRSIDHLLIPGHWTPAEARGLRDDLKSRFGDSPWLIAKIDSREVHEALPELLPEVDGVLISRREIALTVNPATVPMITKEIIQLCNDKAKVVLTASEMLASMRHNVTPTRAEVSDLANAVIDGTDAVLLSEEVAEGRHGERAVEVMRRVIRDIEAQDNARPNWLKVQPAVENEMDAISYNAYRTAQRVGAKAVVCITRQGNTALRLSSYRIPVPIIAVTFSEAVRKRLAICRGVQVLKLDIEPKIDEVLPTVNDLLLERSWLKKGDTVIFVAVTLSPVSEAGNLFTIQKLE